jgi:small-conductance mechanosensitive channel/CRP-like cAMP-binding protein
MDSASHPNPNLRPIITSFLVLASLLGLAYFNGDLLSDLSAQALSQSRKILLYSLQCAIWLSGAYFINTLVNQIFWDRFFAAMFNSNKVPRLLKNVTGIIIFAIAVTGIISVVFQKPVTGIWATSGVISVVIGVALQNMIRDIFVGLAVNIDKPYGIGDYITIHATSFVRTSGINGQVQEINWRTTRLLTAENHTVFVPNSVIGASVLTNHSLPDNSGEQEVSLKLAFNVSPERARRILLASVMAVATDKGPVLMSPAPKVRIREAIGDGIDYRIVYMMKGAPGPSRDLVLTSALNHLHQAGLSLAFPQRDLYLARMPQRSLDGVSVEDRVSLLRRVDIFAPLLEDELMFLVDQASLLTPKQNDVIFSAGAEDAEQVYSMFVLVEGLLYVSMDVAGDGKLVKVGQVTPGQFFGEMSLLTGVPRSATITAATDAVIYEITQASMAELLQSRPEVMEKLSLMMAERRLRNEQTKDRQSGLPDEEATASLASQLFASMKGVFGRIWSQKG